MVSAATWLSDNWHWLLLLPLGAFAIGVYRNWRREKRRGRLTDDQLRVVMGDGISPHAALGGHSDAAGPVVHSVGRPTVRDHLVRGPVDVYESAANIGPAAGGAGEAAED